MKTTEEIMYVSTSVYTAEDPCTEQHYTNVFSVYCGDNYGIDPYECDIRFIDEEYLDREMPLDRYKELYEELQENDSWVCSSFKRVIVTKKISKDGTIRYYNFDGCLLHKEKQKLLECNIEDILDKVMNYENNR